MWFTDVLWPDFTPAHLQEALDAFADKRAWITRMRRGMAKDFSWDASAAEYQRLYRSVTVAAR